jgi:hypothetical protein
MDKTRLATAESLTEEKGLVNWLRNKNVQVIKIIMFILNP